MLRSCFALVVLAALASVGRADAGPEYQGQPLGHWLDVLHQPDRHDAKVRWTAAEVVAQLGPGDKRALPYLLRGLVTDDPAEQALVAFALRRIGAASLDALRTELKGDNHERRLAALRMLHTLAPQARVAVDDIKPFLKDKDHTMRLLAARVVWDLEGQPDSVLPVWLDFLKGERIPAQIEALEAIGKLGASAKTALPALQAALKSDEAPVRLAAARAIVQMEPGDKAAVAVLLAHLKGHGGREPFDGKVRAALVRSSTAAVPGLSDIIKDAKLPLHIDQRARWPIKAYNIATGPRVDALAILGDIGPPAKAAIPVILGLVKHPYLMDPAMRALLLIGADSVEPLCQAVVAAEPVPQFTMGRALEDFGPVARPGLVRLADHKDDRLRELAAETLGGQRVANLETLRVLRRLLQDRADQIRLAAAASLFALDPATSSEVRPVVEKLLEAKNDDLRVAAAALLGKMGPLAKEAAPALAKRLTDPKDAARAEAALALQRLGMHAKGQTAALKAALKDSSYTVRVRAAELLSRLDPTIVEAIPVLLEALRKIDREGREIGFRVPRAYVPLPLLELPGIVDWDSGNAFLLELTDNDGLRVSARAALQSYGNKVLPELSKCLQDTALNGTPPGQLPFQGWEPRPLQAEPRAEAALLLGQLGQGSKDTKAALVAALKDKNPQVQRAAAVALALLNEAPDEVLPLLVTGVCDPGAISEVRDGLVALGKKALPEVVQLTEPPDDSGRKTLAHRLTALQLLVRLGGLDPHPPARAVPPEDVVPHLIAALLDADAAFRKEAEDNMRWLLRQSPRRAEVIKGLTRALADKRPALRLEAARLLLAHGQAETEAIAVLKEELNDPKSGLYAKALEALGTHPAAVRACKDRLVDLVRSADAVVAGRAARALAVLGGDARVCKLLVARLQGDNPGLLVDVLGSVAAVDPDGTESGSAVEALLLHYDAAVRAAAVQALLKQKRALDAVIPTVVQMLLRDELLALTSEKDRYRWQASALAALATRLSARAVPALLEHYSGDDGKHPARSLAHPSVQRHLADLLAHLGPKAKEAIPALEEAREAIALGCIDPGNKKATALLLARLREGLGEQELLFRAVRNQGQAIVPGLVALLRDDAMRRELVPSDQVVTQLEDLTRAGLFRRGRPLLARLLGELKPTTEDAVKALKELLDSPDADERAAAGFVLLALRPNNQEALAAVVADVQATPTLLAYRVPGRLPLGDKAANAALVEALQVRLRRCAYHADGWGGATPALTATAHARDALLVLGTLGERAKGAVALLKTLRRDGPVGWHDAIDEALKKIDK